MQLYYVVSRRRDSEGRLLSGTIRGVAGFEHGLYGPVSNAEAQRVMALTGADVVPVEIQGDQIRELVNQACEKAGIPVPFEPEDFDDEEAQLREEVEAEIATEVAEAEQAEDEEEPLLNQILEAIEEVVDEQKLDTNLYNNPVSSNLNAIDAQAVARRLDDEATDLFLHEDESRKTVLNAAGRGEE